MAPSPSPQASRTRRSRMSLAHPPSSAQTLDKENATIHGATVDSASRKSANRGLRSHSLGPGGLEALGEGTGNRQKIQPLPRSILKPSVPLSPPKPIPRRSSQTGQSLSKPQSSPAPVEQGTKATDPSGHGASVQDEGDTTAFGTKITLKTEEEQQAVVREREREELQNRRDERRKSLANRRVSFAPEATLHTWDVVELPEDATSSSEATNSTRRASVGSSLATSPHTGHPPTRDESSSPSTAPDNDVQVAASPASQSETQRKRKRRSSGIPPMNFNDPHDLSSSPVSSMGSDDTHQSFATGEEDVVDESDTDEDRDLEAEETITTVDNDDDDATGNTAASGGTGSMNMDSSGELDQALREATQRASTQRTGTNDAVTTETADATSDEAADALRPAISQMSQQSNAAEHQSESEDEEMTMEVTQSFGGIIPASAAPDRSPTRREGRKSLSSRRRSSTETEAPEDETMEFTTAVGGIKPPTMAQVAQSKNFLDEDEEMTMDFTAVVGGVVNSGLSPGFSNYPETAEADYADGAVSTLDEDDMDMTVARGTILSPVTERTEPSEEGTIGMDFTAVVGAILPESLHTANKTHAKMIMEEEADHGQLTRSSLNGQTEQASGLAQTPQVAVIVQEPRSPSSASRQSRGGRQSLTKQSSTPRSPMRQTTPLRKAATPTKQLTPNPGRPITPTKTPPAKNVSMRTTSPKRLFRGSKASSSIPRSKSPKARGSKPLSASKNAASLTPPVILTPKSRRVSGVGADQAGMGSPRVAAMLDRRTSIGEQAAKFTSGRPTIGVVRFQDPRELAKQLENERAEEARRESGRGILQQELDAQATGDADSTGNLREMIDGLTPKKTKLNGRKSIAIGAAKGLLGKRPRELDEDDEDATPKRLRGKNQSPVKQVLLPAPPTKDETTGRLGKAPLFKLPAANASLQTPAMESPPDKSASSPDGTGRFKDTRPFQIAEDPPVSFNEQLASKSVDVEAAQEDDPVHLRDFLNMTSIRFMDLTTTKRRHTVAPGKSAEQDGEDTISGVATATDPSDDRSLAACVVAGASTIPMLELYQHSCRELKKYISEGRSIVREIEDDTLEDNPPLFREYLSATPQVRSIMDNQFKNVKTHARLLSKEMWYEWRMKLLEGLKDGLVRIQQGLDADEVVLAEEERILETVMPQLRSDYAALDQEAKNLHDQADEIANCDPDELQRARNDLMNTDKSIAAMLEQIEELESQVEEKTADIDQLNSRKTTCVAEIKEAEQVREEFRGWSAAEVLAEKEKVDSLESSTGWTISSAHEGSIVLLYKSEVALYLNPLSFKSSRLQQQQNSTISLSYAAEDGNCSTTQRFFLQLLRARLLSVPQARTPVRQVLALVENGWNLASCIAQQVKDMRVLWPTQEVILSDESLQVTSTVLLRKYRTKIDASFDVTVGGMEQNVAARIRPHAQSVYGEDLKVEKMTEVLSTESGLRKADDAIESWATAVETVEKKLNKFLAGKDKH